MPFSSGNDTQSHIEKTNAGAAPLVSVIVPVYHSEDTLGPCVDSILAEGEYENLELLLVANGLTEEDPALLLCRDLEKSHEKVRLIVLSEAGVSAARNEGIRQAKGELIRFVDSDDKVYPGGLSAMVERMLKDESDLVVGGYAHFYYGNTVEKLPPYDACIEFRKEKEHFCELYLQDYLNPPWNKLFRKELIREEFDITKNLGEDLCFNLSYLIGATKISVLQQRVYRYVQDDRGTSLSGKLREDRIDVCRQLYFHTTDFFRKLGMEDCRWAPETKVISTFLDEIGQIPLEKGLDSDQKKRLIKRYVKAIASFVKHRNPDIRLRYPDHKILYGFAKDGRWKSVHALSLCRAQLVRMKRK